MTSLYLSAGLGLGMGGGLANPLARLLGVPNLVSAYDAADTGSMFQGATTYTAGAKGSPVYWMIDQAGLGGNTVATALANATNKVTNGDFTNGTTGWTFTNATPSVVGGRLRITNPTTAQGRAEQQITGLVVGRAYVASCDFFLGTATAISWRLGTSVAGTQYGQVTQTAVGLQRFIAFVATSTTLFVGLTGDNGTAGTYVEGTNFVVKELTAQLATTSGTTARPTLTTAPCLDFDGVNDILNANVRTDLGAAAAVYYCDSALNHVWLTGLTIGVGNYALPTTDWGRLAIFSAEPSASDKLVVQAWGAAYPTPPFDQGFLAFYFDFGAGTGTSAGQPITLSNLTDNGDGTYSLSLLPDFYRSKTMANATTVTVEYTVNDPTATGSPIHWTAVGATDFQYILNTGVAGSRPMYEKFNSNTYGTPRMQHPTDNTGSFSLGRHRVTVATQEGVLPHAVADNFITRTESVQGVAPTQGTPTKLTVGKNGRTNTDPFTLATVNKIWLRCGMLSDAEIEANHLLDTVAYPVHVLADSFGNGNTILDRLAILASSYGYIAYSSDPVGGSTLTEQIARWTSLYPKWLNSDIIWIDGGLTDTNSEITAAFAAMAANQPRGRWLYVEAGPQLYAIGDPLRQPLLDKIAQANSLAGTHLVQTYAPLLNTNAGAGTIYHDGSANDLADIANGLWPRSLRISVSDFHPGSTVNGAGWSGVTALADLIHKARIAKGWLAF